MKQQQKDTINRFKSIVVGSHIVFSIIPLLIAGCSIETTDDVKIVAHRGGVSERPENTMAAFKRAIEVGSDIIEIDLRTSKDGQLFIIHDAKLDRTTNGSGRATDLTLDELRKLDAGSWFDPSYSEEKIPSFKEVLEWAKEEKVVLLLDLKESDREFAENVADDVQKYGTEENMVVGIRSPLQAQVFSELLPNSRQLAFMGSENDIEEYTDAGVDIIRLWLHWMKDNPVLIDRVRQTGTKLMINGTDGKPAETRMLMNFSPDWILIDDPAQLIESLRELK